MTIDRRQITPLWTLLAVALPGCSSGMVAERFFTPDSEYLIWRTMDWGGRDPVRMTETRTGKNYLLGEGLFAATADREYLLLVRWLPRYKDKPVTLVRLEDRKRWELPPLPHGSVKRYGSWRRYHGDLRVQSVDDLSLSFRVFVNERRQVVASRHALKSDRWEIEDLVAVGEAAYETSNDFSPQKAPGRRLIVRGCSCGRAGHCAACQEQRRSSAQEYSQVSPNGSYLLYEHLSAWGSYAELRKVKGKRGFRLTTSTGQVWELFRRIGEFIHYGGA